MTNVINKTVKEIKQDIGVYFKVPGFADSFKNLDDFKFAYDFSQAWRYMAMRSFKESTDLVYYLISGSYKNDRRLVIQIREKLYNQYAKWFSDDENSIYHTQEDAEKYLMSEIVYGIEHYINLAEKESAFRTIVSSKDSFAKKMLLKTTMGKKLNYIIKNKDKLKSMSLNQLFHVEIVKDYRSENEVFVVPYNWNELINNSESDITVIHKDKLIESTSHLFSVSLDNENKSVLMKFETNSDLPFYNFHNFELNKEHNKFSFETKMYFNKKEAIETFREEIEMKKQELFKLESKLNEESYENATAEV